MVMRRAKLVQYLILIGLLIAGILTGVLHPSAIIFLFVLWLVIMLISKAAERHGQKDR